MRPEETGAHFHFGPEREAHEAIWTPSAYAEFTAILAALPVHWRFFVKTRLFERLRERAPEDGASRVRAAFEALRRSTPGLP
jgi:N-methylhydantoinase B